MSNYASRMLDMMTMMRQRDTNSPERTEEDYEVEELGEGGTPSTYPS